MAGRHFLGNEGRHKTVTSRRNIRHIITRVAAYPQERKVTIGTIQKISENTAVMFRRVGSTTYKVTVHFNEAEQETMADKIVRLIGSETLDKGQVCGIMELPQMSRQPERSTT